MPKFWSNSQISLVSTKVSSPSYALIFENIYFNTKKVFYGWKLEITFKVFVFFKTCFSMTQLHILAIFGFKTKHDKKLSNSKSKNALKFPEFLSN